MQVTAIQFEKAGAPSVLKARKITIGTAKSGEALVRHTAIGSSP